MKSVKALLVLVVSTSFLCSFAQKKLINFQAVQTKGLSQNTVYCILKDHQGFMWFGTQAGLNKFDGYKFTVYAHTLNDAKSIAANDIAALCEDDEGNIWVATTLGGISEYNAKSGSFINYQHNQNDVTSLSSNQTRSVYKDQRGNLWVGTSSGLNLFDKKTKKFMRYFANPNDALSLSNSNIYCIFEDKRGNFWVGTEKGLNLLNRRTGKCEQLLHNSSKTSIAGNYVNTIFEDSYGNFWVGTNAGLDLFDRNTKSFSHFGNTSEGSSSKENSVLINTIAQDENFLWIGTKALLLFDIKKKMYVDYADQSQTQNEIKDFEIFSLLLDDQNILWAGTGSSGVYRFDKNLAHFSDFKLGRKNSPWNTIWSFAEDRHGNVWIGTDGGLSYFNRQNNSFTSYTHQNKIKNSISGIPYSVLTNRKNNDLWIGTDDGLDLYQQQTGIFKHLSEEKGSLHLVTKQVRNLFQDSKNNIWIGTSKEGAIVFDNKTQQFKRFRHDPKNPGTLSSDEGIYAFCEDKEGNIWIPTNAGVDVYNPSDNQFTHYDSKKSVVLDNISTVVSLYADTKGTMWLGTTDGGLISYNKKANAFTAYTKQQGLINNTINYIIGDQKGFLWLSTNDGIVRFDPVAKSFRNYSVNNGLQGEEFDVGAGMLTKNGEIFFGGINGFNVFNPNSLSENKNIPPVIITGFELFNKPVTIGSGNSVLQKSISQTKEITLKHNQSVFTLEFAALNYTISEQNNYAYMLEGFDEEWNYVGAQRKATYTNLDPGTYTFKVKASNNDGLWNKEGVSIKIIITPPFWLTWWFKIIAFLIIVGTTVGFYKYRISAINKQKINLQRQVELQTRQLLKSTEEEHKARMAAEQANIDLERKNTELEQFAYVASHDLQEPLRTTSSFVELIQNQYHGKFDEKADRYFDYIIEASDRMKLLIKDLLDYSRIGRKKEVLHVDCNIILQQVLQDLNKLITDENAIIKAEHLPVINGYPTELQQLFQNLVINAIKFRTKNNIPQIQISAKQIGSYWQFSFNDNGIGIDKKHNERIFIIFQRLHTRGEYMGSGIGLSHCKKIVELHGGKIWVDSVPGEGSTFHFTLPSEQARPQQIPAGI
ncbi:MAG: two-component regulator propeller domain-containing protein [Ginsengibacter sp.]